MSLAMTVIVALVSFVFGLFAGLTLIRPPYPPYPDRRRYPDR